MNYSNAFQEMPYFLSCIIYGYPPSIHPLRWQTYIEKKQKKSNQKQPGYWLQLITFLHDPANRIRLTNWHEEQKP